jgi:hypothetical protein
MQSSTSPRRKSFRIIAGVGTLLATIGATVALIGSVGPAQAANIASQADTQVAVFMLPLTLLVMVLLFEVVRFVVRHPLPAHAPARQQRLDWSPGRRA